ncbi:MAG: hypothetical protein MdMp024_0043 [Bacteroidales bacterium]
MKAEFEIENNVLLDVDMHKVTKVVIPHIVKCIGEKAFADCRTLTSVTIPKSVTKIGEFAFYDCSSLTSVSIPKGVRMGAFAFDSNVELIYKHE